MKIVNEMKISFKSKSENEGFARTAVCAFAAFLDPGIEDIADLRTAVSEAVTNCIVHAYRGTEGLIEITARILNDNEIYIRIKDKGCGIPDVKRAMEPGIEYDDLYSAGCIGLLKAAEAFDCERGVKFSTYAVPVILGEIKRLFRDGGTVKVSRSLKELSLKAVRVRDEMSKELGREPTLSELGKKLDTDECAIAEALSVSLPPVSLTDSSEEGGGQIDVAAPSPDVEIGDTVALRQVLEMMESKDRELIFLRYYKNFTQSAAAQKLGMTQVQVSRREKKLLTFMREQLMK